MRQYYINEVEIFPGRSFEAGGLSHAGNWLEIYSDEDKERFNITFVDTPDPEVIQPRKMVYKSAIIDRLNEAGKLETASIALNQDLYTRERWYSPDRPWVYADDVEVLAFLQAIGADPEVILA